MIEIVWRCRDGVRLVRQADGAARLSGDGLEDVPVRLPARLARCAYRFNDGVSDRGLTAGVADDLGSIARLFRFKGWLQSRGLLVAELHWRQRRLAVLQPRSPTFDLAPPGPGAPPAPPVDWRLSRFAFLRRDGERLLLEATDAPCDVAIDAPELLRWIHDAVRRSPPADDPARREVLSLLAPLGFFDRSDDEEPAPRRTWEFHDRLFHRRSRLYDDFRPVGSTYRFRASGAGPVACPPAVRRPHDGATVDLPVPGPAVSRSLVDVMESRRSGKEMGSPPLGLAELSALLYRVARVTATLPGDCVRRPHPSAGALHELEFYVAVRTCQDLAPGFYHYRSDVHALTCLGGDATRAAADMTADCAAAWGQPDQPPQCVMIVASRLPRQAWKYSALAYRLSLLNAGVVLQCLYLVAADLGLAGAAAGAGHPAHFARATGVSSWEETSIVEFGFGSRPAGSPA